ncbi:MAG: Ig-like domain repeat protein [Methanobrevibacter sp.]|uniref:beta strand repeat-containing protein n=1 Tax=Methanobrevibacter sp. TaxID=66852 RepID=UPI0025E57187|nr:Ig-like domain-containing protein [Methanobrevibacter sp.]MBE6496676.1 Ig-like domain repeat protein [Methanobrevibacter sp.]
MLCFVMLSVGATFAADNATDVIAIDDEITIDEPLAVEQDVQDVSANESSAAVVTPETIGQYIDDSGQLYKNVTADEIVFNGTFNNLNLTVERPITLTGGFFNDPNFEIYSSEVILRNFSIIQNKGVNSIFVAGSEENHTSDVLIDNVNIVFTDDQSGAGAIPIEVMYSDDFMFKNSFIAYGGRTNGYYNNNAVRITSSKNAIIFNNQIFANLVSASVGWAEEPAGSGNWVSAPMSEAIVIKNSDGAILDGNLINVTYGNVTGDWDTIYTVDVSESDDVLITNNEIISDGFSYIYGIIISGDDFTIRGNNITSTGVLYANGIDIEGPATGVVENNNIDVSAVNSAYAIYSGMNGKTVSANYTDNNITGKAYNIFGFSLGDVESNVKDNFVDLEGNYTTGLAARTDVLNVDGNRFILTSSEEGNESVQEGFGVEARGILVIAGNATIANNTIATNGKGVVLSGKGTSATLEGNFINVVGNADKDAYALYADELASLIVNNNTVDYQGTTNGTGVNNGVYVYNTTDARITGNTFTLDLVSSYVPWFEIPAGSGNWTSFPVSEGIVVDSSEAVQFMKNNVTVTYGDVVGSYDTIYAVSFKNSDYALIEGNKIDAKGHTHIYGIILSGDNFNIGANTITVESDNYYANGIDIEGPATGVVYDNTIDVTGVESAYAIYSGMNGQNVSALYQNNTITGKGYNVFGMSLGDVESNVKDNSIILDGNYTTGIAYRGSGINATGNYIVLSSTEQGNLTVWENFGVEAVGIKVINGTAVIENNTIATPGKGIHIEGAETDAHIFDNFINVVGNDDQNAYAIFAIDAASLFLNLNNIDYQGATKGTGVNNAVYVNNVTDTSIIANNFTIDLVSSYVPWFEIPAGTGNWVSFPISEGIVIEDTVNPVFSLNKVDLTYGDVVGSYDTIYAVDVKADDAIISDNEINAKGHTYIYGLIITGDNFTVEANNITAESDNYYANGIDIEGPATGSVYNNNIRVNATTSAYGIYSGMNGQDTTVLYDGNYIFGVAYNVFGMSLGDVESTILNSEIIADGNYTTGIAYRGTKLTINNTSILAFGSNVGNEAIWEAFGVESVGVKIVNGTSEVTNNRIMTTGNYPVNVGNTSASVHDNNLIGLKYIGDEGVANADNAEVYNNIPEIGNKTAVVISITEVNGNCEVSGILKEINGTPVSFYELSYTFDGVTKPVKTDENGTFKITGIGNGKLDLFLEEDSHYLASDVVSLTLTDIAPVKEPTTANITIGDYEIGKDANVTIDIPGATGNVSVIVDGVETIAPLDENGSAVVTIENVTGGEHSIVVIYTGDETHAAAYKVENIFLEQFDTRFDNLTVEGSGYIDGVLVNALGDPIANATVVYIANGVESNVTTDEYGWFIFNVTLDADVTISYAGTDVYMPTELSIKLQDMAPSRTNTSFNSADFTQYSCDFYEGERGGNFTFQLLDMAGNPLANKTIYIGYNGVTLNRTTDENGYANVQINLKNAGLYTFVVVFLGDKDYNATMAVHKVTIEKKTTSISASAKTFKATAKTKKYTVTLKTIKGSSIDGKTYLAAGKKVSLKINGKTYTGKTNAKGQVTFSLKITKKGKFTTKISFAGDKSYEASSKSIKITIK